MYIFITHFFTEYVIFKYLLPNITCRKNYTASFFRTSGRLASFLHPSLDIYPAFFYHTALSLIHYAGASCDRQTQRHHH
ncbi:hypothetical protein A1YY_01672 [Escherichia coli KTE144]|nr:hypothetical protein [Escherichia coli]ELG83552.1 hypothetical protein A1YY_01672 [Escherichia coli KTE144]TGI08597.1 hypothetical protein E5S46_06130 [Escherichia coli]